MFISERNGEERRSNCTVRAGKEEINNINRFRNLVNNVVLNKQIKFVSLIFVPL